MLLGENGAERFGGALAFRIGGLGFRTGWPTGPGFRHLLQLHRLAAVNSAGAKEERAGCLFAPSEFQHLARARNDGLKHQVRIFLHQLDAGVGGAMEDMRKVALQIRQAEHIALHQFEVGRGGQMRSLLGKGIRVSRQDHGARAQIESLIGAQKTFQQPTADEPRAARHQESGTAQFGPQGFRQAQNLIQIRVQRA